MLFKVEPLLKYGTLKQVVVIYKCLSKWEGMKHAIIYFTGEVSLINVLNYSKYRKRYLTIYSIKYVHKENWTILLMFECTYKLLDLSKKSL